MLQPWSWCVWKLAHFLCKIAPILWKGEIRFRPQLNRKKKAKKQVGRILFFKFFFNCHFRRFWMRVIGKQNCFNFIELASEPQIHWILLGKEFPWDSYFDVLSIQSISGRQKSILSLSLFRSLSLQTQKASQKVVSAEHEATFFSFSLFPWDPKTCQYHPRKPHGRVRTFFFLSLWCTESPANHVFSPSFFSNLLNICSCQKWSQMYCSESLWKNP